MKDRRVYFTVGGKRVFANYHDLATGELLRTVRLFETPEEVERVIIKVGALSGAIGFVVGILVSFSWLVM